MMTQMDKQPVDSSDNDQIVALPDAGYRWKHYLMALLLIGGGFWFAYDGWVRWPANNKMADQATAQMEVAQNAHPKDTVKIEELAQGIAEI